MYDYDVVIVGAGPAGVSAAFFLRYLNKDLKVLVIERLDGERFGLYHRMCGEAISELAFKELAPIEPCPITHRIHRVREHWPDGTTVETNVHGYIIDRENFLRGLLERFEASGGIKTNDTVVNISRSPTGFDVKCTSGASYNSRYLIGADGAGSIVRKQLFKEEPPIKIWTDQYIVDKEIEKDVLDFTYDQKFKGGYKWEFPDGEHAKIGFPRGTDVKPDSYIEMHRRCIPMGGMSHLIEDDACLVGDAGGLANPLTASGLRTALVSGRKVAESIAWGEVGSYDDWWYRSKYSSLVFLRAYDILEGFDNDQLNKYAELYKDGYSARVAMALLFRREYRYVGRAYMLSIKYGW